MPSLFVDGHRYTAQYGIGNLGFNLHLMCTALNPKYRDYDNTFHFSDGFSKTISYTGKFVTGISRVELEIDPSYTYMSWRFWLRAQL